MPSAWGSSIRSLVLTGLFFAELYDLCSAFHRSRRVLHRQFSYEMDSIAGRDFFLTQLIKSQGLLLDDAISWILSSKNFLLAVCTTDLNVGISNPILNEFQAISYCFMFYCSLCINSLPKNEEHCAFATNFPCCCVNCFLVKFNTNTQDLTSHKTSSTRVVIVALFCACSCCTACHCLK